MQITIQLSEPVCHCCCCLVTMYSGESCFAREEFPPNAQVIACMAHVHVRGAGHMPVKTAKKAVYPPCVQTKAHISLLYKQKMLVHRLQAKNVVLNWAEYGQTRHAGDHPITCSGGYCGSLPCSAQCGEMFRNATLPVAVQLLQMHDGCCLSATGALQVLLSPCRHRQHRL